MLLLFQIYSKFSNQKQNTLWYKYSSSFKSIKSIHWNDTFRFLKQPIERNHQINQPIDNAHKWSE